MPHLLQCLVEAGGLLESAVGLQSLCTLRVSEAAAHVVSALVYEHGRLFVEPLHALAVLPEAVLDALLLLVDVGA